MNHDELLILPATSDDVAALDELINTAYRGDSSRQGWTTEADLLDGTRTDEQIIKGLIQDHETRILKLTTPDDQILGCVELRKEKERMYLGMLTVRPGMQGKGIGKLLMKAGLEHARETNCSAVYMTVLTPRTELIDWYFRLGFRDTGERKPFSFNDSRFGKPKRPLQFAVLTKELS